MGDSEDAIERRHSEIPEILVQMHGGVVPEIAVQFPSSEDVSSEKRGSFLTQPALRKSHSTISLHSLHGLLDQTGKMVSNTMSSALDTSKMMSNTMSSALDTSGLMNVLPDSKQMEFLMEPAMQGASKLRKRLAGEDPSLSDTCEAFNQLPKEWRRVFMKLDRRDGKGDGQIKKSDFLKWIAELDEDSAFKLESKKEITKPKLQSWISNIDEDRDAYISQEEWVVLVDLMEKMDEEPKQNEGHEEDEVQPDEVDMPPDDTTGMCPLACFDEDDIRREYPSRTNDDGYEYRKKDSTIYTKDGYDYCDMNDMDKMIQEQQDASRACVRTIMGRRRIRARLKEYTINAAHSRQLRWWPPPIFTISVSTVQLVMYFYHVHHLIEVHGDEWTWDGPTPFCSTLIYDPERRFEVVRYGAYSFVHVGAEHITFNLVMQLVLGIPLEMFNSFWRVALVYTAGVFAGSIATSTLDPQVFLAGASGGVYALITAHLSSLILNWNEDRLILRQQIMRGRHNSPMHGDLFRLIKLVAVVFFAAVDTGLAIYTKHYTPEKSSTGYIAHLAGALAGLTVGIMVLKNRKKELWESRMRMGCVVLFTSLMASGIVWNVVARDVLASFNMTNSDWDFFAADTSEHLPCNNWQVDYNETDYYSGDGEV